MLVALLVFLRGLLIFILAASLILFVFNKLIMRLLLIQYFVSPGSSVSAILAGSLVEEMDHNGHLDYDDEHHDLFVTNLALLFSEEINEIVRSESEHLSLKELVKEPIEKESIQQYVLNTYFLIVGYNNNMMTNLVVLLTALECLLLIILRKFASDNTLEINLVTALQERLNETSDGCLDDIIRTAKEYTNNNTLYIQSDVMKDIYDIIQQNVVEGEVFK